MGQNNGTALILATINSCSEYSYIGGNKRSKDGVGIVVDGEERHILLGNPWQELAVNELELIDQLFNKARYLSVVEKIEEIKEKVDVRLLGLYSALGDLVKGYYEWDCFRHRKSKNLIKSALAKLKNILMLVNLCDAKKFLEKVEQNFEYIENICRFMEDKSDNNELNKLLCLDLISNAIRRADKENKYDDAVARLYSAMEKFGKMYLLDKGIDNSHASPNDIPLELRDQFKKYMEEDKVKKTVYYKFGLNATLSLLSVIDPKYNQKYQGYQKQLGILMKIRNNSILAHGSEPISKDTYDKMLEFVLSFAEISKDEVVSYPEFNISLWAGLLLQK